MKTPILDEKIRDLENIKSLDEISEFGEKMLSEFKGIKSALNLHFVINWVACEERLPKPRERVLITDGTLVVEAHLNQRNGYWDGWNITGTESLGDITMWAYKPTPPCL